MEGAKPGRLALCHEGFIVAAGLPGYDGIYFVTATSLRGDRGYRLLSRPEEPVAQKYPIGFPFALSLAMRTVTRTNRGPRFYIYPARVLVAAAGCAFLVLSYVLLLRLRLRPVYALGCVFLISLHPLIFDLGGLIVSDLLYSTLALIICLFALTKRVPEARILKVLFLAGICAMAAYCWKPGERRNIPTVHHERVNMPGDWDQARGCSRRRLSVVF
ncbi:MAG: hypothetical protein ACLQAT_07320 [Candidatus Binataceae bacterium]